MITAIPPPLIEVGASSLKNLMNKLFTKRALAAIIDYAIFSIPIFTTVAILMQIFFENHISQVYPFILMGLIYAPYLMLLYFLKFPAPSDLGTVGISLVLIIIVSTIFYTLVEMIRDKNTFGKRALKIKLITTNQTNYSFLKSLTRNFLKTTSVYLFFTPFLFAIKSNKTSYDKILDTTVIEN